MSKTEFYILKGKILITLSVFLILISYGIEIYNVYGMEKDGTYIFDYRDINIKDMATVSVSLKEVVNDERLKVEVPKEVLLPTNNDSVVSHISNERVWYLPCEIGSVSGGISYSHYAIDIVSPRGENEAIYPIADGVISGIYTDSASALIVTVTHDVDGKKYSSQYVHLSRYADNIYIGREVTVNDCLGYMGSTGIAYGTHLHLALVDCSIFDSNDSNCSDLNGFFNYGKKRLSEGFSGLYSVIDVPTSWTSR